MIMSRSNRIDVSAIITLIKYFDYEMLDDAAWDDLREIDPSDEEQMLNIFNKITVPEFEDMDRHSQELIESTLYGILSSSEFDYQRILGAVEMPFEPIEEPKRFFSLLWFALFKKRFG